MFSGIRAVRDGLRFHDLKQRISRTSTGYQNPDKRRSSSSSRRQDEPAHTTYHIPGVESPLRSEKRLRRMIKANFRLGYTINLT